MVTASGLVFIGATIYDKKFRAFDARDREGAVGDDAARGGQRDARGVRSERQAVRRDRAGGGKWGAPSGGSYVAFALP